MRSTYQISPTPDTPAGRGQGDYGDELATLRDDLDRGVMSLEAGLGRQFNIEDIISVARARRDLERPYRGGKPSR